MSHKYDNINLYVMPSFLPEEQKKPLDEQEMTIARNLGAEWSENGSCMLIGKSASIEDAEKLIELFSTDEAQHRVYDALDKNVPEKYLVDRWMMARAAWDEVERQGGSVERRNQGPAISPEDRVYFWTNNDKSSYFSIENLEKTALKDNIHLNIDFEPKSDYFGLRYTDKNQILSDDLLNFAGDDAKNNFAMYRLRLSMSRQLFADVSSSIAGKDSALVRPVVLPNENSDPESEKIIVDRFNDMSEDRQKKVLDVTSYEEDPDKIKNITERLRKNLEPIVRKNIDIFFEDESQELDRKLKEQKNIREKRDSGIEK